MRRLAIATAALLLTTGASLAQATIEITPEQEMQVYSTLHTTQTVGTAPADFEVNVGAVLPESIELQSVPETIAVEPVRKYRYVVIKDRVVLVEPESRKIVKIIEKRG